MYVFFSPSKAVNSPLWKGLIKGHTLTTFHLACDWMPSNSHLKTKSLVIWESIGTGKSLLCLAEWVTVSFINLLTHQGLYLSFFYFQDCKKKSFLLKSTFIYTFGIWLGLLYSE